MTKNRVFFILIQLILSSDCLADDPEDNEILPYNETFAVATKQQCQYNLDSELVKNKTTELTADHLACNALIAQPCANGSGQSLKTYINSNPSFKNAIGSCQYYDADFIKNNCQSDDESSISPNNFTDPTSSLDRDFFNLYGPKPSLEAYNNAQKVKPPIDDLCSDTSKTRIIVIENDSPINQEDVNMDSRINSEIPSVETNQLDKALVSLPPSLYENATIKKYSFSDFRNSTLGKNINASRLTRGMFILPPNENCTNPTAQSVHFAAFKPLLGVEGYPMKIGNDPIIVNSVDRPSEILKFLNGVVPAQSVPTGSLNSQCFKTITHDGLEKKVAIFYPTSRFLNGDEDKPYHHQDYFNKCGPELNQTTSPQYSGLIIPNSEIQKTRGIPPGSSNTRNILDPNKPNRRQVQPIQSLPPIKKPSTPILLSPKKENTLLNPSSPKATLQEKSLAPSLNTETINLPPLTNGTESTPLPKLQPLKELTLPSQRKSFESIPQPSTPTTEKKEPTNTGEIISFLKRIQDIFKKKDKK